MHGIGTVAVRFESGRLQERLKQLKWRKWLFRGSVLGLKAGLEQLATTGAELGKQDQDDTQGDPPPPQLLLEGARGDKVPPQGGRSPQSVLSRRARKGARSAHAVQVTPHRINTGSQRNIMQGGNTVI